MTVFVPQQPRPNRNNWTPDFSSALNYGELEFIFDSHERIYALPGPSLFKARKILEEFVPEEDYILVHTAGDPMAQIIIDHAMREKDFEFINYLYWDRKRDSSGKRLAREGFYVPIRLNLKERKHD